MTPNRKTWEKSTHRSARSEAAASGPVPKTAQTAQKKTPVPPTTMTASRFCSPSRFTARSWSTSQHRYSDSPTTSTCRLQRLPLRAQPITHLAHLRNYHFTFHTKRRTLGISDPEGWREHDHTLQQLTLIKRPSERPQPNPNPDSTSRDNAYTNRPRYPICHNYQDGVCVLPCKFTHLCKGCNGPHPANRCTAGANGHGATSNANMIPLRDRVHFPPGSSRRDRQ